MNPITIDRSHAELLRRAVLRTINENIADAENYDEIAQMLNDGTTFPLFAPGEKGAAAATALAADCRHTQQKLTELLDTIDAQYYM
jgi:hypothetical protein